MRAEVIAEEQRVQRVGSGSESDVDVHGPSWRPALKEQLEPLVLPGGRPRRHVIAVDPGDVLVADRCERWGERFEVERGDRDLDVDYILRGEAGDGGRADVVDASARPASAALSSVAMCRNSSAQRLL